MPKNFNALNQSIAFVALCLIFISSAAAQNTALPAEQVTQKVDEYMNAAVKADGFSGSILVARDGTVRQD